MNRAWLLSALLLAPQEPKPEADETVAAQRGDLTPVFELEGLYEALESAEFRHQAEAFQGEVPIVRVAEHGAAVKKGDVLLEIDLAPMARQKAAHDQDLRAARATHEKARAEADLGARGDGLALAQAETALRDAETALKLYVEVEGKHLLESTALGIRYTEEGVADQKEELDQLLKMYKTEELTNATAEIVVRRTRRNLERTETQLKTLRAEAAVVKDVRYPQQVRSLEHGIATARNALELLKVQQAHAKVLREVELAKAQAALQQQEEQDAKLRRDLERFPWKAPFDGRVFYGPFQNGAWAAVDALSASLRPGEKLPPGQVLLSVCGARTRVRADVPEADYFEVHPGMGAEASPVAAPDSTRAGTVAAKGVTPLQRGPGPSFEARIDLAEPPADLFPGMKSKVVLKGRPLKGVLLVPSGAVQAAGTKSTVTVQKDGKSQPREVTVGPGDGKRVVIRKGLEPGERVVVPK
jgi:multidrug resistance efflux pump